MGVNYMKKLAHRWLRADEADPNVRRRKRHRRLSRLLGAMRKLNIHGAVHNRQRWKAAQDSVKKPLHFERTVFGDGDGASLNNVVSTSARNVGQLSCGVRHPHSGCVDVTADSTKEHFNPLYNFSIYSQGEEIHIAAWPPLAPHPGGPAPYSMSDAAVSSISQICSMQAQCFTLLSTAVITAASIEEFGLQQSPVFN